MGLVGVELGAGRVADDPQPVGDPEPAVPRERRATARVDAVVLEAEVVERERPADGEQDRVALGGRAVVQLDDVGTVRSAAARAREARTPVRTDTPSRSSAARMTSELRGWSVGARRGPDWTIVVGTPKRT